jgi:hypothetical protein
MDAQPLPWFLSLRCSIRGVLAVLPFGLVLVVSAFAADTTRPSGYHMPARPAGLVAIPNPRGELEWGLECKHNSHDIAPLGNGKLLFLSFAAEVVAMTPATQVGWYYV